jgi:lipopolysaccharide/colanic/teichoic acid biosynthesis glycosyltransferase
LKTEKRTFMSKESPENYRIGWGKRMFDVVFSLLALLFFSPLILLIAIAIKLESKGPLIYAQQRVGTGYDLFTFYKFRTMVQHAEKQIGKLEGLNEYLNNLRKEGELNEIEECPDCKRLGHACSPLLYMDGIEICENHYLRLRKSQLLQKVFFKVKDDPRITKVGKIIRQFHFDEIPQFYNVLKGDMSVVGNRPLPLYEAEHLTTDEWAYRFMAPAGITGLWQIHASELHNPEERIALDNQYAMIANPWTDFKIIAKTILTFFRLKRTSY